MGGSEREFGAFESVLGEGLSKKSKFGIFRYCKARARRLITRPSVLRRDYRVSPMV